MSEIEKIKQRYESRKTSAIVHAHNINSMFSEFMSYERELKYAHILNTCFDDITSLKIIEIGAGTGHNIHFLMQIGIPFENIWANELIEERSEMLKRNFPQVTLDIGNALNLEYINKFDVVLQSTVFTSILDDEFKKQLANKMFDMLKPSGIVLWYDFKYNNPKNKDVRGITKSEINYLFPNASKIDFHNVTLAPPIGRKVGRLYNLVNKLFPFLRTHVIAVIYK